ncbi:protein of unknown function DUF89 [Ignisphaera aggregans DSM 17230]|uniref:Damage-control phosphatase ARMT1-like metal-binding domain-containing protein n=1 Tax=Ignisphaera aggregans (strain DSM 17230 / JCM 13409 / AQ1.S1) TaxID=583356 RepID=E0SR86_IGNAA|nr:protein of unknown function DUF89 [Ignisphaera aggregans DSM 17230]
MKLYSECLVCQIQVRYRDICKIFSDEEHRIKAMRTIIMELNNMLNKCNSSICTPTHFATNLFRIVKRISGIQDPYQNEKSIANKLALNFYKKLRDFVLSLNHPRDRLIIALKFSLIGNTIDLGVKDYEPPSIEDLVNRASIMNIYGDVDKAIDLLIKANSIVVLLDNSGEAVFDRLLSDVLRDMGKKVFAIVKGGAFQNDITIFDINEAELMNSFDNILSTNSDASSIFLDEVDSSVIEVINSTDIIVSKGMANYEYLTEIENILRKPIIYLFVAKCRPISIDSGIPFGKPGVVVHGQL